jgi:soluble lytic murein transglycosylase
VQSTYPVFLKTKDFLLGCKIFFYCKNVPRLISINSIIGSLVLILSKKLKTVGYFYLIFFFLSSAQNVFASSMTQKLWGGLSKNDVEALKEFSSAIKKDDHKKALEISQKYQAESAFGDTMRDIALWNKYSQIDDKKVNPKNVSFNDIYRFVNDNRFFPNFSALRHNAEKVAIANKIPYKFSKQYFANFPASNTDSKIYLLKLEALQVDTSNNSDQQSLQKDITDLTLNIWIKEDLSAEKEAQFLADYGNKLTEENHIARINNLLWDGDIKSAKRIFYLVNEDYQKLFSAIIEINKNSKNIKNIISSIPRSLRNSDLLAYKIILWYKENNKSLDDIVDILEEVPAEVSNPQKWWSIRKLYGRELLKTKDYKVAYKILSNHGLEPGGSDFSDAEWTAGWVALRFLDKPKIAYNHFNNLYLNVGYPVSISRAAYWLGMASVAMGDKPKANDWYKIAAKYPTYFYGQLAIHKHRVLDSIGSQNDIILPKDPDILGDDIKSIAKENSLKVAYILALIGDKNNSTKIFEYVVANAKTDGEIAVVMKVVNEMKNQELDVKISKAAAKRNVFFIKDKFQIIKTIENDPHAPLVHAIIKQESGFAPSALSAVGAIGFMQIMPDTAKLICRQMGMVYSKQKLANDVDYNIILGSYYIKSLIDQFNGSELLAIASYNAGPNASKRWINDFYDPRNQKDIDKVVDWIELITYYETRNYVQRIMENVIVYKYLMSRVNYDDIK